MKKKILFIIPSLRGGGVERVLVVLLRHLDRSLFDPVLLVFETRVEFPEELPEDVRTLSLQAVDKRGAAGNIRLIAAIARSIKQELPEIICSFMEFTNHFTGLAMRIGRSSAALYFTYHGVLSHDYRPGRLRSAALVKWILHYLIYPKAAKVVCVSKGVLDDMVANWRLPPAKGRVIYNPIDTACVQEQAAEHMDHPWFSHDVPLLVACGRLAPEKNYPLLLRAFSMVKQDITACRLIILGQGPLKEELKAYADTLGVSDSVEFMGFQKNPFKFIGRAKVFVLSSFYEGFGNVLVEAMSCGTPVISTNCPAGPGEIINNGENGLLVPVDDDLSLARAIVRLLNDDQLRQRLMHSGLARAEYFAAWKIIKDYEGMFLETSKK